MLRYERDGTAFFCPDHGEPYEIYLQSDLTWTCHSTVHESEKKQTPQVIARLAFRPSPQVFLAICEGWFDEQVRQPGLGI